MVENSFHLTYVFLADPIEPRNKQKRRERKSLIKSKKVVADKFCRYLKAKKCPRTHALSVNVTDECGKSHRSFLSDTGKPFDLIVNTMSTPNFSCSCISHGETLTH